MEQTECSETSAYKLQTPENYPKESIQNEMKLLTTNIICLWRTKIQLDATQWFIEIRIRLTCFGHYYAHNQEHETIQIFTAIWHITFVIAGRGCGAWDFARLNIPQPGRITYSHTPDPRPAITKLMCHVL